MVFIWKGAYIQRSRCYVEEGMLISDQPEESADSTSPLCVEKEEETVAAWLENSMGSTPMNIVMHTSNDTCI